MKKLSKQELGCIVQQPVAFLLLSPEGLGFGDSFLGFRVCSVCSRCIFTSLLLSLCLYFFVSLLSPSISLSTDKTTTPNAADITAYSILLQLLLLLHLLLLLLHLLLLHLLLLLLHLLLLHLLLLLLKWQFVCMSNK